MWDFILTDRPVRISIQKYSCVSLLTTLPFHELYLKVFFSPVFIIGTLALYPTLIHFNPPVVPLSRTDAEQDWRKRTNCCHICRAQDPPKRNANPIKPLKCTECLLGRGKQGWPKLSLGTACNLQDDNQSQCFLKNRQNAGSQVTSSAKRPQGIILGSYMAFLFFFFF